MIERIIKGSVLPLLVLLLVACSAPMPGVASAEFAGASLAQGPSAGESPSVPATGRFLIREAYLELAAGDLQGLSGRAEQLAREAGGYVESARVAEGGRLSMVLRVPEGSLDAFLGRLASLGEVRERSLSARDVTEQVVDLEARLANLRAVRDRLRTHLGRASDVPDILSVERELARVQGEIDSMEARLKSLRDQAALSRVTLEASQPRILGPLGYLAKGIWWGLSKLFVIR